MAPLDDKRTGSPSLLALTAGLALTTMLPAAVAAADPEPPNAFLYEPPDRRPPGRRTDRVRAPVSWVLERVAWHLSELGMRVERADRWEPRLLVALYAGDPREFVDCGVVRMVAAGDGEGAPRVLQQYSANR